MKGGRPFRPRPDGFDERAPHTPTRQLARDYRCDHSTAIRWLAEIGIVREQSLPTPMPDGFAEVAAEWTSMRLESHFDLSAHVVQRFRRVLGIHVGNGRRERPAPPGFAEASEGSSVHALAERFGVSTTQIGRWRRRLGLVSACRYNRPTAAMQAPVAHCDEDLAARHLRCDAAVYRCRDDGHADPRGEYWRYGRIVLTPADMIARARRKGFDPDEWRRIA